MHVEAMHDQALPWSRLRGEVCGGSDPATAWPGSLRRDIREGLLPIGTDPEVPISRLRNAIHLSNGTIEGLREIAIWFDTPPDDVPMARALHSGSGWTYDQLLHATHCRVGRQERVLVEATNGLSLVEATDLLQAATPTRRSYSNRHSFERLAIARTVSERLRGRDDVRAVFVSGSVARGRCSADSDIDLVVLSERAETRIERHTERGVVVEVAFHAVDALLAELAGMRGSMQDLKRAARLSQALPLHDPDGLHARIANAADAACADEAERSDLIGTAQAAAARLREVEEVDDGEVAARMRSLCDIACYLLIADSPLRYQKPKWVIDDLQQLGARDAVELLARWYALDTQSAAEGIDRCEAIIVSVGERLGLPSFAQARRAGLIDAAPEYSFLCQCLDDAKSLLGDGRDRDAGYAAKFAGKMAICLLDDSALVPEAYGDIVLSFDALFAGTLDMARSSDLDLIDRLISRSPSPKVC